MVERAAMTAPFRLPGIVLLTVLLSTPSLPFFQAFAEGAGGRASPDLTVAGGSYGITPSPPRLQDTLTVNVTVVNQGDMDVASAFTVAFYLNNTTTPLNRNNRVRVNSLAQGAGANVSCTWNTQTSETSVFYSGINYTIIVFVDCDRNINELNEVNNNFTQNQSLGPERLPDLGLVGFSVDSPGPVKGDAVRINATITNRGEVAGKFFKVWSFADEIGHPITSTDVNTLNVSEFRNVTLWWNTSGYATGTHNLLVIVNPEFYFTSIAELDWGDNNGSMEVVIRAPDMKLELVTFDLQPEAPHLGDLLSISCSLLNNGTRDAENVTVRLFLEDEEIYNQTRDFGVRETFSFGAQVDTSSYAVGDHPIRIGAGNIDHSRSFTLLPFRMADLVPQNVSLIPPRPKAGQSIVVSLEVANQGEIPAGACDLSLFVDSSRTPVAGAKVPALSPGDARELQFLWDSAGIIGGTHWLRLLADSGYIVAESNETNNNYAWPVDFEGELDLALDNLTVRPPSPRAGEPVQFSLRVRNIGSLPAVSANLTLNVEGVAVDSKSLGPLAPYGKQETSLRWTTAGIEPGFYDYEIDVESFGNYTDVDGSNNLLQGQLELLPPPPSPDLVVGNISLSSVSPRMGDNLTVIIAVQNNGNLDAGPSSLMIYLVKGSALLKFSDSPVGVPGIPAGTEVAVTFTRDTRGFRAGSYILNVTVDYKNEIAELNEGNNHLSTELQLLEPIPRLPSLQVEEVQLEGQLEEGYQVNIIAVVANTGEADAYGVTVRFIIDGKVAGDQTIELIRPGTNRSTAFLWNPTSGKHTVQVRAEVADASPSLSPERQLSVNAPPAKGGQEMMTAGLVVAAVVLAASCGAALFLWRRRRTAPPAGKDS